VGDGWSQGCPPTPVRPLGQPAPRSRQSPGPAPRECIDPATATRPLASAVNARVEKAVVELKSLVPWVLPSLTAATLDSVTDWDATVGDRTSEHRPCHTAIQTPSDTD